MDSKKRKEMKNAYREKPVIGGICAIRCSGNNRLLLQPTANIEGLRNRFNFAKSTGGCPEPPLRSEWEKYGIESFSFEVLEELKKGETQSDKEFSEDIEALYDMWLSKTQA